MTVASSVVVWLGYKHFFEKEPPLPAEAAITHNSERLRYEVDCSLMNALFKPDTEREISMLRGEQVEFAGRTTAQAIGTLEENRIALVAYECAKISRTSQEDITGRTYEIFVENQSKPKILSRWSSF